MATTSHAIPLPRKGSKGAMPRDRRLSVERIKVVPDEVGRELDAEVSVLEGMLSAKEVPSYPRPRLPPTGDESSGLAEKVEEAVKAGHEIGHVEELAPLIAALLQRADGVEVLKGVVQWAVQKESLALQLPPLLPEFPDEVRDVLRKQGPQLLSTFRSATGEHHTAARSLLTAGLGLQPSHPCGGGVSRRAYWQPYGVLPDGGMHPSPIEEEEVRVVRMLLRELRNPTEWIDASGGGPFPFSEGGDLIP
eukprot:Sspe_Gene.30322::Locus_14987_Transcript_1_1_Confidence_1.000_Length_1002::g.30322::m.30322